MNRSIEQVTQIRQTKEMFKVCTSRSIDSVDYTSTEHPEAWHQAKIVKYLESCNFEVTKVITATKHSTSDILAQSSTGRFWRIEVKKPTTEVTEAQLVKLENCWHRSGLVMCASGYPDFIAKYDILTLGCLPEYTLSDTCSSPKI